MDTNNTIEDNIRSKTYSHKKTVITTILAILIYLLILILGGAIGYYYSYNTASKPVSINKSSVVSKPYTISTSNGLKYYKDSNLQFSFPSSWLLAYNKVSGCHLDSIDLTSSSKYKLSIALNQNGCPTNGFIPVTTTKYTPVTIDSGSFNKGYVDTCATESSTVCNNEFKGIVYFASGSTSLNYSFTGDNSTETNIVDPTLLVNEEALYVSLSFPQSSNYLNLDDTSFAQADEEIDSIVSSISLKVPSISPTPTSIPNTVNQFSSNRLGISFNYVPNSENQNLTVSVIGDRALVGSQYVEVMNKDPNDSIDQALHKMLTNNGFSTNECTVVDKSGQSDYPTNYVEADFQVASSSSGSFTCPPIYTPDDFGAFFLMDKNNPGKLLFVMEGQMGGTSATLNPNSGVEWLDTIKIF